ncbi:putative uncharacterized protein [Candidatus Colimorpha enterica]|uniref:Phosphoglucomutase n=1 Tax=Candidatus Colimorpha enterica TaxID=3083063 RepID=R6V2B1_9BACT|nr:putative uncharacterized protein [Candidatus Colimorpha enterica]
MMEQVEQWLETCRCNPELREEVLAFMDDEEELIDRFAQELTFGTGGIRGLLGVGTNRMNIYTVTRATLGLGKYLSEKRHHGDPSAVISYDNRNYSKEFATRTAEVLSSFGIRVYLFNDMMPTPVLSFAVRYLRADCGVMITASHNSKEYNGYKVYNEKGCQITDHAAKEIYSYIQASSYFAQYVPRAEKIQNISEQLLDAFLREVTRLSLYQDPILEPVVYTPLHGTGLKPVTKLLTARGLKRLCIVPSQAEPDGNFSTCPYPNPEEKEALSLGIQHATETGAALVLATDPDADRVGIAVTDCHGKFHLLSGNETGILLMNYMLLRKAEKGTLGVNPCVIKTIVTSDMAFSIAAKYGVTVKEVLTGFKYIGEEMERIDNFVMGFEESCGYLVGTHVRDKDAVSAVMMIVEMEAYYRSRGQKLYDVLMDLYHEHGYWMTALTSVVYHGASGSIAMNEVMERMRNTSAITLLGQTATVTDFSVGVGGLPCSNVLRYTTSRCRVILRPSGTEPKLKVYYQVNGSSEAESKERLARLQTAFSSLLQS